MKKEQIYIDLSKCSDDEIKHIFSLLPEEDDESQYEIFGIFKYLHYDEIAKYWFVDVGWVLSQKTKLTYPEFIKLFEGEKITLRQQFESEIKAKGIEFLFESNNQNYITWLENKINSNQ